MRTATHFEEVLWALLAFYYMDESCGRTNGLDCV